MIVQQLFISRFQHNNTSITSVNFQSWSLNRLYLVCLNIIIHFVLQKDYYVFASEIWSISLLSSMVFHALGYNLTNKANVWRYRHKPKSKQLPAAVIQLQYFSVWFLEKFHENRSYRPICWSSNELLAVAAQIFFFFICQNNCPHNICSFLV